MALIDDLLAATAPAEILRHVARATWARDHDGAECSTDRVPAPADLGAWLDTPDGAAVRRAGPILWLPDVWPYPGEADGPAGMLVCPMDGHVPGGPPARPMMSVDQASGVWRSLRDVWRRPRTAPTATPPAFRAGERLATAAGGGGRPRRR